MDGDKGENGIDEDKIAAINSTVVGISLLTIIGAGYLINTNRIRHVPGSAIAMVLGSIIGIAALIIDRLREAKEEERLLLFNPDIFFYVLLPPIIFEAGFSADQRIFVNNLGSILSFAVLGTAISTFVVAEGVYFLGFAESKIDCYLFGSLISATDPVATLALFGPSSNRKQKTDATFRCLIFGESLLNDAVAVVLFVSFEHWKIKKHSSTSYSLMTNFIWVLCGSLLIGLIAGLSCSWCFRRVHPRLHAFPAYEVSIQFFVAYLSYALAQVFDLSGITALFFCGLILSKYNRYNLSENAKTSCLVTFDMCAMVSESLVFGYLGAFATFSMTKNIYHWNLPLILASLLLLGLGRAAHIFPMAKILNMGREEPISMPVQIMMWFSGLRGAVAFALALRLPSLGCGKSGDYFITTTIAIVAMTTLVLGSAMESIALKLMLISSPDDESTYEPMIEMESRTPHIVAPPASESTLGSRMRVFPRGLYHKYALFDKEVLQQLFGGKHYGCESDTCSGTSKELQVELWSTEDDTETPQYSRAVIFE